MEKGQGGDKHTSPSGLGSAEAHREETQSHKFLLAQDHIRPLLEYITVQAVYSDNLINICI